MVLTDNRWRGLQPGVSTEADVLRVLGEPGRIFESVGYGALQGLRLLTYYGQSQSAYTNGKSLVLMTLAPTRVNGLAHAAEPWLTALGRPENPRRLPSTAGKGAYICLYASRGLALHVLGESVDLIEQFPPIPEATYVEQLYEKPADFRL